jgi:hypothetical protein
VPLDCAAGREKRLRPEILPRGVPDDHTAIEFFVFPATPICRLPRWRWARGSITSPSKKRGA